MKRGEDGLIEDSYRASSRIEDKFFETLLELGPAETAEYFWGEREHYY